jgi:hypothetical protein
MCPKRYLRHVTYGCVVVTHGPGFCTRKGRAPQLRAQTAATIRLFAGRCCPDGEALRHLSATSISLFAAGPTPGQAGSRRRSQGCFHCKTFSRTSSAPSRFCEPHRFVVERDRESGITCRFAAEKKAWLGGLHSTTVRFNSNIVSIVCSLKNSSKSTKSSCLPYVDRLDPWNLIRCRRH